MQNRYHIFGLANIPTRKEYTWEPFTPLTFNMAKMLMDHGEHVIFYGAAGSNPPCSEFVEIVPEHLVRDNLVINENGAARSAWCNYPDSAQWRSFHRCGRYELKKRYRAGDISLINFGVNQRFIEEESALSCEFLCGYSGIFANHKVFPSHAWRHYLYGELKMETKPNWGDAVIPHYIDTDDYEPHTGTPGDYLLFMGRLCPEKGPDIAIDIANRTGHRIIVAGVDQYTHTIPDWVPRPKCAELVGYVDKARRSELMRGAKALLHPCRYLEPFGMVTIEAMAHGTPVIASNWGAMPEIIQHGKTGYLCEDMDDFKMAVNSVCSIDRLGCRRYAEENHGLETAYRRYSKYFTRLRRELGAGWYETNGEWRGHEYVKRFAINGVAWKGAEVGVDDGKTSSFLLRNLPNLKLVMVDLWDVFEKDSSYSKSGDEVAKRNKARRENDYQEALRVTDDFYDRRVIMRDDSVHASVSMPDAGLDFVIIDADHSYEGVSSDIEAWARKVRPGGFLCGHDYNNGIHTGVARAVDEYASITGKTVEFGADWTWFIKM